LLALPLISTHKHSSFASQSLSSIQSKHSLTYRAMYVSNGKAISPFHMRIFRVCRRRSPVPPETMATCYNFPVCHTTSASLQLFGEGMISPKAARAYMGRRGASSPGGALKTVHRFPSHPPWLENCCSMLKAKRRAQWGTTSFTGTQESTNMPPSDTAGLSLAPSRALSLFLRRSSQRGTQKHGQ